MDNNFVRNISLGVFVIVGAIALIVSMYIIGAKQNFFGSNFRIYTEFKEVNGLMAGHNVRFAGIDVGTVEKIEILNDTTVKVTMLINNDVQKHIKKKSQAMIGTDGLMGNKLINIISVSQKSESVNDGDYIKSKTLFNVDEIMKTLATTNNNTKTITEDLKQITKKINNSNALWSLLNDYELTEQIKNTIVEIKITGERTALITGNLQKIVSDIKAGKGSIGSLLMDTTFSGKLNQTIVKIDALGDNTARVTGDLGFITEKIKRGEGNIGTLIMDTTIVKDLNESLINLKDGSKSFSENMEALKHSILFKRYFRKKAKSEKK
ncbi:MAG: MCE family protein [Bacteroidetes bacterium]|nr:MCE family protein [Bacteroidota bacterium]